MLAKIQNHPGIMLGLLTLGISLLCSVRQSIAADELGKGIAEAARDIAAVMKSVRAESATVLPFEDKTTFGATVLPGLQRSLSDELTRLKVTVKANGGAVGIKGILKLTKHINDRVLRVEFQLTDQNGEDIKTLNVQIPRPDDGNKERIAGPGKIDVKAGKLGQDFVDDASALVAFGGNVDRSQPPIGSEIDALAETSKNPTAKIVNGDTAKPSADSPFALQVIGGDKPKQLRLVDGQPFVDLRENEKFSVRMTSDAPYKTAVSLSLDGLSSFHFSKVRKADGAPKYSNWILGKGSFDVQGWHIDNTKAQEFLATSFDNSKLKELGMAETPIGAITVVFRTAWDQRTQPPKDENQIRVAVKAADGSVRYETKTQYKVVFIGGGDEVAQSVTEVKPQLGRVRGVISIRYRHPMAEAGDK